MDLKKCIFVIDSTTTALMVSLIAKGKAVNCIFERKIGVDTDKAYELFMNFSRQCLNIAECEEIIVPSRFFLAEGNVLSRYLTFYYFSKKVRKVFKERSGFTYIGPGTSSIMNCLQCDSKNIYYLYHGTIDCYRYYKTLEKNNKLHGIKNIIKKYIFDNILYLPNSCWNGFFSMQGYSLINMNEINVKWLNYKDFNCEYIEKELADLKKIISNKKWVMFCPIHDVHTKDGISSSITNYNQQNIDFLQKYISKDEHVMIKCHPSIYQMNDMIDNNLNNIVMELLGIDAKDVVDYIPEDIGSSVIPMEVLFRYCNFVKLICVETTTLWVLRDDYDVLKISDITSLTGKKKRLLKDIIQCLSHHNLIDEHYLLNV